MAGVSLLAHGRVLGGRFIGLHAFRGQLREVFAHQLLAVGSRLPCAAESLHQLGVLGLFLLVQILQQPVNLHHAGKVWTMLDAELGLFLFQIALAGVNLLQQGGGKVAAIGLQARIGGDHQLRVALPGRAVLGLAQNTIRRRGHQLPSQFIDLQHRRGVFALARFAVGQRLGRGQQAVLALKGRQPLLVLIHADFQFLELALQPRRGLSRGLHPSLCVLFAIGVNQGVHHAGRKGRIPRSEANLNQQRARQSLHAKPLLEALQQPFLRIGGRRIGAKIRKFTGKSAHEPRRLVELEAGNHLPGQLVAAEDVRQRLLLHRRGKNGGRHKRLRGFQAERRNGRGAQRHPGAGLILIGSNQAIQQAGQQQATHHPANQPAAANQHFPKLAQASRGAARALAAPRMGLEGRIELNFVCFRHRHGTSIPTFIRRKQTGDLKTKQCCKVNHRQCA